MDGVYFTPTLEQCFSEFKKAIFELTIDETARLQTKNLQQEKKISDLEITRFEFEELKRQIRMLEKTNQKK